MSPSLINKFDVDGMERRTVLVAGSVTRVCFADRTARLQWPDRHGPAGGVPVGL
jgi:hypothetical protein